VKVCQKLNKFWGLSLKLDLNPLKGICITTKSVLFWPTKLTLLSMITFLTFTGVTWDTSSMHARRRANGCMWVWNSYSGNWATVLKCMGWLYISLVYDEALTLLQPSSPPLYLTPASPIHATIGSGGGVEVSKLIVVSPKLALVAFKRVMMGTLHHEPGNLRGMFPMVL